LFDILQFKNNLKTKLKKTKSIALIYTIGIYCMSRKKWHNIWQLKPVCLGFTKQLNNKNPGTADQVFNVKIKNRAWEKVKNMRKTSMFC